MAVRVCCVCLGNICRSPTAEGILIQRLAEAGLQDQVQVDSAGTAGYHIGKGPDPRSLKEARRRGFDLPSRARRFTDADFDRFDYVLAMDHENVGNLRALARGQEQLVKIHLFRSFDPDAPRDAEVPDPYYGGDAGFREVFDLCDRAALGFIGHLRETESFR